MPAFDIVSGPDPQAVREAVANTMRNLGLRIDFRDTCAAARIEGHVITLTADTRAQIAQIEEVLLHKMMKRHVSASFLAADDVRVLPDGSVAEDVVVKNGASAEELARIVAALETLDVEIEFAIEKRSVHVQAADTATLRTVIQTLKKALPDIPLEFVNPTL